MGSFRAVDWDAVGRVLGDTADVLKRGGMRCGIGYWIYLCLEAREIVHTHWMRKKGMVD